MDFDALKLRAAAFVAEHKISLIALAVGFVLGLIL